MKQTLGDLERRLGYQFSSGELITRALTHRSYSRHQSSEQLEMLGDRVLNMLVVEHIFDWSKQVGELAEQEKTFVSNERLARIARMIGIPDMLLLGGSEIQCNGRENVKNLADAIEALIGAIYLDGGLDSARDVVGRLMRI